MRKEIMIVTIIIVLTLMLGNFGVTIASSNSDKKRILAIFSYIPDNPYTNENISFIDESISSHGPIKSWIWNFGDGNTSTEQNPTHSYAENATYNVSLEVTAAHGLSNDTSQHILVLNRNPIANFSYFPNNPTDLQTVNFIDSSNDTDGNIVSWHWIFGDGNTSTTQNPSHQYSDDGTFTVTLNVTDNDGATNETSQQISILNVGPTSNFSYVPSIPTINETVQFTDTSTDPDGTIVSWLWDFGDGNISTEQNPQHNFTYYDTFIILLTVIDNDKYNNSKEKTITITEEVISWSVQLNFSEPGGSNTSVVFGEASDANDGRIPDVYDAMMLHAPPPPYIRSWFNDSLPDPYNLMWEDYRRYPDDYKEWNLSIQWAPSDYNSSTNITISWDVNFINASEYNVVVLYDVSGDTIVADMLVDTYYTFNASAMIPKAFQIRAGDVEPPSKVTGLTVTDAKDGKLNLAWNATDDNVAVDYYNIYHNGPAPSPIVVYHPTTIYIHTGLTNGQEYTYNVSAVDTSGNEGEKSESNSSTPTVTDNGGGTPGSGGYSPSPHTNQNPIAKASAGEPYMGVTGKEIIFNGSLSNDLDGKILSWNWEFGDGTNGSGEIVIHTYSSNGTYTVVLTVIDNDGATDSCNTIAVISHPNILPTSPEISGRIEGNKNIEYEYTFVSTDDDNDTIKYSVDWDDGTVSESDFLQNGTAFEVVHSWASAGKYTVTIDAYDNQTSTSTEMIVMIDAIDAGVGYITDDDGDGTYDTFHSSGLETELGQENGKYLIDIDGDGEWDYFFDLSEGISVYTKSDDQGKTLIFIIVIVISVLLLVLLFKIFWKKKDV